MSISGGLKLRAVAGGPSVIRFTHSNCTGINASGIPSAAVRKILKETKVRFEVRHWRIQGGVFFASSFNFNDMHQKTFIGHVVMV